MSRADDEIGRGELFLLGAIFVIIHVAVLVKANLFSWPWVTDTLPGSGRFMAPGFAVAVLWMVIRTKSLLGGVVDGLIVGLFAFIPALAIFAVIYAVW